MEFATVTLLCPGAATGARMTMNVAQRTPAILPCIFQSCGGVLRNILGEMTAKRRPAEAGRLRGFGGAPRGSTGSISGMPHSLNEWYSSHLGIMPLVDRAFPFLDFPVPTQEV